MIRSICPDCASYAMILRLLRDNSPTHGETCSFCKEAKPAVRVIVWGVKERKVTTAALSMIPWHKKGVGVSVIVALVALEGAPDGLDGLGVVVGPLVKHGLAEMKNKRPHITKEGRRYLANLRCERFQL